VRLQQCAVLEVGIALSEEDISSTFRTHNEDGSSILLRNHHAVSQLAGTKPVHNLVPIIIFFTKHDSDPTEGDKTPGQIGGRCKTHGPT
jgi:hypothetical protein